MLKRNLGSALRGKTKASHTRDLRLKILTHDLMILRRKRRVETEQDAIGYLNLALIVNYRSRPV